MVAKYDRTDDILNGTAIENSVLKNDINVCPMPENDLNMVVGQNCEGYEPLVRGALESGNCVVSCNSCRNFKDNICVVDLYDRVLARIDDSK